MSVDPNQISLSDNQRRLLATAADQAGVPWQSLLEQAFVPVLAQTAPAKDVTAAGESAYETLARLGLIGCIEGTPPDLSVNKAYLKDLGRNGS